MSNKKLTKMPYHVPLRCATTEVGPEWRANMPFSAATQLGCCMPALLQDGTCERPHRKQVEAAADAGSSSTTAVNEENISHLPVRLKRASEKHIAIRTVECHQLVK